MDVVLQVRQFLKNYLEFLDILNHFFVVSKVDKRFECLTKRDWEDFGKFNGESVGLFPELE